MTWPIQSEWGFTLGGYSDERPEDLLLVTLTTQPWCPASQVLSLQTPFMEAI